MKIVDCVQGTAEWFDARLGRVTASEVCDAVRFLKKGEKKGEESKTRAAYKAAIVSEILTGRPSDTFVSSYMRYGSEMEPLARAAYEMRYGVEVDRVGFIVHPEIDRSGASPDGLVGEDGGLEIKCPKTETHIEYTYAGKLPPEYEPQVMWNLACSGRQWWDFASFDIRLPQRFQLFVTRVFRDEQRIAEIEDGVRRFLYEVDEMIARLEQLHPEVASKKFKADLVGSLGITDEDISWIRQRIDESAIN